MTERAGYVDVAEPSCLAIILFVYSYLLFMSLKQHNSTLSLTPQTILSIVMS